MKHNQKYLGFFALFAFMAVPGLLAGEWGQAVWLVWLVWGIFFFVSPDNDTKPPQDTNEEAANNDRS